MNAQDVTKKMLEGLVKKFNDKIVSKEDPLPTGKKTGETKDKLLSELKKAGKELLQPGDEKFFTKKDGEIMEAIGIPFEKLTTSGPEAGESESETEDPADTEEASKTEEDSAPAEKPKPAKKPQSRKKKQSDPTKSNKAQVYLAWKNGEKDVQKLHKAIKGAVKEITIKMWISAWGNNKNLPAVAKTQNVKK